MSLTPKRYDAWVIKRGSTWDPLVRWEVQDEDGNLQPMDLTGWEGRMQLRKKEAGVPAIDVLVTILDPAFEGYFRLKLFPSQTLDIPKGAWNYDIEFYRPDPDDITQEEVRCPLEGTIAVTENITAP